MKLKYETPYIARLELDENHHLFTTYSDGTKLDIGYLPDDGINILYKDKEGDKGGKRYI